MGCLGKASGAALSREAPRLAKLGRRAACAGAGAGRAAPSAPNSRPCTRTSSSGRPHQPSLAGRVPGARAEPSLGAYLPRRESVGRACIRPDCGGRSPAGAAAQAGQALSDWQPRAACALRSARCACQDPRLGESSFVTNGRTDPVLLSTRIRKAAGVCLLRALELNAKSVRQNALKRQTQLAQDVWRHRRAAMLGKRASSSVPQDGTCCCAGGRQVVAGP